jgi:glycosyltransferase involved in cell wall biosynthesis
MLDRGDSNSLFGSTVWVVIPAYNEGERIGSTLRDVLAVCNNVVVVDDGSADDTKQAASKTGVWVLSHCINRGQGAALQTGIEFALRQGAEIIVTFDADGQHDAAEIPRLIAPIRDGTADVVLGSRFLGQSIGMPWTRRMLLRVGIWFTRITSQLPVTDAHNGFRAFSRFAASKIRITQDQMAHASELLDQIRTLQLRFVEAPVTIRYTAATLAKGQSSWNAVRIVAQLLMGRILR